MKTIFSLIAAAALIMSALTACGARSENRTAAARITPTPAVTATARPAETDMPRATTGAEHIGDKAADAAKDAGDMVGDAVQGVGDAVGGAARDAGNAVGDMLDGDDVHAAARP